MSARDAASFGSSAESSAIHRPSLPELLDRMKAFATAESEALHDPRESQGGIMEMRHALQTLRNRLEPIYSAFQGFELEIDRLYITGDAPRDSLLQIEGIVRTHKRELDELIWVLPRAEKEPKP